MGGEKDILRERVLKANSIELQVTVLSELQKRRMSSRELKRLVQGLGGIFEEILPSLKATGLLRIEHVDGGYQWLYSARQVDKQTENNNGHDKTTYTYRITYDSDKKGD